MDLGTIVVVIMLFVLLKANVYADSGIDKINSFPSIQGRRQNGMGCCCYCGDV